MLLTLKDNCGLSEYESGLYGTITAGKGTEVPDDIAKKMIESKLPGRKQSIFIEHKLSEEQKARIAASKKLSKVEDARKVFRAGAEYIRQKFAALGVEVPQKTQEELDEELKVFIPDFDAILNPPPLSDSKGGKPDDNKQLKPSENK